MARLLVNICASPDDPTRLALGLLVARMARAQGHDVDVFLAGDAVHILRAQRRDQVQGLGTGSASEHWTELQNGGARLFASRKSAAAREIEPEGGVELVPPDRLVELIMAADQVVTY